MSLRAIVLCLLLPLAPCAHAALDLGDGRTLELATREEGARLLGTRDDFVARLSPFDRAARLKSEAPVDERAFLDFVAASVVEWSDADRAAIADAFASVPGRLAKLLPGLPPKVFVVQTSGREEGDAAYTRGSTVVIPTRLVHAPRAELAELLSHELFHVLSRNNPKLREKLYAAIGFTPCAEAVLPDGLEPRRITNPDAPRNDHCTELRLDAKPVVAVPVLYADSARYDAKRGGAFFDYLKFQMLVGKRLIDPAAVEGYFEQIGRNTDYVIHPEEVLAVNFAYVVTGKTGLPSPEIPERIARLIEAE
jgi:hypothetical protein